MRRLALVVMLVACGRVDFDRAPRTDGAVLASDTLADDGAVCAQTPCKLTLEQCGCASGEACQRVGATTDERGCVEAGTVPEDGVCNGDFECVPGHPCINIGSGGGRCMRYCASDADCGGGQACAQLVEGVGVGFCGSTCTLSSGCFAGDACKVILVNDFDAAGPVPVPVCVPPAGAAAGTGCGSSLECAAGLFCEFSSRQCQAMCARDGSLPCASGTCGAVSPPIFLGGVEYGTCR